MAISSTDSRWEYTGDGSTTGFTYSNKIFVNTQLEVYSDSVLQTLTTDYTVSGVGEQTGGTVTYVTAPANDVSVVIVRVVPDTQPTVYPSGGSFPSKTVEDDFDRRTIASQQQEEKFSRTMLSPAGEAQVDMTLPVLATRAGKHLGFDSNGAPVELDAPASTTSVSTYGAALILAADPTAAQKLLNLSASVVTGGTSTVYTYTSEETITSYDDGPVFGVDFHTACGATPTINRDGFGAKSLKWPNGTALAANDVVTGQKALLVYDGADMIVLTSGGNVARRDTGVASGNVPVMDATGYPSADGSQITNIIASVGRGHIDGLILSNNGGDAAKDIDIAAGEARDGGNAVNMVLAASITKQLNAVWAVGTAAGALDGTESVAGTPDASTWYHIWLIRRSDTGVVDILASESATAPTMPTNYDQKRRIGAVLFDATPDIIAFYQWGDEFFWKTRTTAVSDTTPATSKTNFTVDTPLGIETLAVIAAKLRDSSLITIVINSPDDADVAPDTANNDLSSGSADSTTNNELRKKTNTSSELSYRSVDATATLFIIQTVGWIDPRGRNG